MNVGIFGGSFDPIHTGHLILAERCCEAAGLERVVFVPNHRSPLKPNSPEASDEQRLEMVRLAISGNDHFERSSIETDRDDYSFTVDTLTRLTNQRPDDRLFLLMGADALSNFHAWRMPQKICDLAQLVYIDRPNGQGESTDIDWGRLGDVLGADRAEQIQNSSVSSPLIDISSTEIRHRVQNCQTIRYLTPRAIEAYIRFQKLYRVDRKPGRK